MQKKKKKRRLKPIVSDCLFAIGGMAIGEVVAGLVSNIAFLKWLSFEVLYGIQNPIEFNLLIFKFTFGCTFRLSPALILFCLLGLILSRMLQNSHDIAHAKARSHDLHPDKDETVEDDEEFEKDEEVEVDDSQQFDR